MLCEIANVFPDFVGDLIDREAQLTRNFREETITDMWVASFVPLRRYGVFVDLAIESETGADLEIWFLSNKRDRGVGFIIQAKRSKCRHTNNRPSQCAISNWGRHRFEELDHASGDKRSKGSQARDLVTAATRTGRAIYPIYAFYMPKHIHLASGWIESVMLADGHLVRRQIVLGRRDAWLRKSATITGKTRFGEAKFKQVDQLKSLFISLDAMFCLSPWASLFEMEDDELRKRACAKATFLRLLGTDVRIMNIPGPDEISASMSTAIQKCRVSIPENLRQNLPLPQVTEDVPSYVLRLANGHGRREGLDRDDPSPLARSRMIFVASVDTGPISDGSS